MFRAPLVLIVLCVLVVLTSFASSPPNLERTLAAQRELVGKSPGDALAHNDLSNLLILAGRDPEAEAAYRRAVELDPRNAAVRFNLALLMQQQGRLDEAQTVLEELLKIAPKHAWANYQRGVLFHEQGNRSKALEHYARAFAYDPALSFASENPHVIDNELSTEALLMAEKYRTSSATRVPRQYGDPQRIADMMLDETADEEGESVEDWEAEEVERETGAAAKRKDRRPAAGDASDESGAGRQQDAGAAAGADLGVDRGERPRRAVGPQDAGGRAAVPVPATRKPGEPAASRPPGSTSDRQEATEERFKVLRERMRAGRGAPAPGDDAGDGSVAGDNAEDSLTRTRVAPRRQRYLPGTASTGRLELELLPAEPAERYAALGP